MLITIPFNGLKNNSLYPQCTILKFQIVTKINCFETGLGAKTKHLLVPVPWIWGKKHCRKGKKMAL